MAIYSKTQEVCVSASDAINMVNDPNLIVVMAIPDESGGHVTVTYWSKNRGQLPPWIVIQKAA